MDQALGGGVHRMEARTQPEPERHAVGTLGMDLAGVAFHEATGAAIFLVLAGQHPTALSCVKGEAALAEPIKTSFFQLFDPLKPLSRPFWTYHLSAHLRRLVVLTCLPVNIKFLLRTNSLTRDKAEY